MYEHIGTCGWFPDLDFFLKTNICYFFIDFDSKSTNRTNIIQKWTNMCDENKPHVVPLRGKTHAETAAGPTRKIIWWRNDIKWFVWDWMWLGWLCLPQTCAMALPAMAQIRMHTYIIKNIWIYVRIYGMQPKRVQIRSHFGSNHFGSGHFGLRRFGALQAPLSPESEFLKKPSACRSSEVQDSLENLDQFSHSKIRKQIGRIVVCWAPGDSEK